MVKKLLPRWTYSRFALAALAPFLLVCTSDSKHTRHFSALDTMISVTVYSTRYDVDATLDSLEALFGREEDSLSISKQSSEVYRINHRTDSVVTLSATVRRILAICRKEYALSGGLFDVTVEPLKTLYGLESHQKEAYHVPTSQELSAALANMGFSRIRFVSDSVVVIPAGMHIDFGGIGKGFVLTQAGKFLHAHNIHCFLVNGGGDLITSGIKPSGDRWNIGVQDPRNPEKLSATLACTTGCVFTSGDYERCFFDKGVRYHHLFDPRTGMPGRLNMSATVIGTIPVEVDAIVKAAFLMPSRNALAYLASRGLQGYLIDSANVGWASLGLKGWLKPDSGCVVHYE